MLLHAKWKENCTNVRKQIKHPNLHPSIWNDVIAKETVPMLAMVILCSYKWMNREWMKLILQPNLSQIYCFEIWYFSIRDQCDSYRLSKADIQTNYVSKNFTYNVKSSLHNHIPDKSRNISKSRCWQRHNPSAMFCTVAKLTDIMITAPLVAER